MIGPLLAAAAAVWAAMLPAAAYAASQPAASRAWQFFALAVYSFGGTICHQRPERSFHLSSAPLPVCARCTGIYVGAAVIALALPFVGSGFSRIVRSRRRDPMLRLKAEPTRDAVRIVLALAGLPLVLSLVYEWTTGDVPSNAVRAATGALLGGTVAFVVLDAISGSR